MSHLKRLMLAALLGICSLLLISCGSSTHGLIPASDAGPLQSDFETVARVAQAGDGNCTATAEAIRTTERDFERLPSSVDRELHNKLKEGVANLRGVALELCAEPFPSATATSSTSRSTSTTTTSTTTKTTTVSPTETSTTTTSTATAPPPGGGAQAPDETGNESVPGTGTPGTETEAHPPTETGGVGVGEAKAPEP